MSFLKTQVVMHGKTHLPADVFVNDFYWFTSGIPATVGQEDVIFNNIVEFYNVLNVPGTGPLANHIGSQVDRATPVDVHYTDVTNHLDGTAAGSPYRTLQFTLVASEEASSSLPSEVAACLTYHADYGTAPEFGPGKTRPRSSLRGRIYIGPLTKLVVADDPQGIPRPTAALSNAMIGAGQFLRRVNTADTQWMQWSRKHARMVGVAGGWVDNAFDTQRRRGEAPTGRANWT